LLIPNLSRAFFEANKQLAGSSLVSDLADLVGLLKSEVRIDGVRNIPGRGGRLLAAGESTKRMAHLYAVTNSSSSGSIASKGLGTIVTAVLALDSDFIGDAVRARVNQAIASGAPFLTALALLPSEARVDLTQLFSVDTASEATVVQDNPFRAQYTADWEGKGGTNSANARKGGVAAAAVVMGAVVCALLAQLQ
jgi:hypothetical protein